MNKRICIPVWTMLIVFIIGGLVTFYGTWLYIHPTDKVVMTWKQPDEIKYNSVEPFYLSVIEDGIDIGRLPFSTEKKYYIYVGGDSGKPTYGHIISYSFHPDVNDI